MFLIVPLDVDASDMPHGSGNICLGRLQKVALQILPE